MMTHRKNLRMQPTQASRESRFLPLVGLLALLGCAGVALSSPPSAQVQPTGEGFAGRVTDGPGAPVAGATVHLVPVSAMDLTTPMTASSTPGHTKS